MRNAALTWRDADGTSRERDTQLTSLPFKWAVLVLFHNKLPLPCKNFREMRKPAYQPELWPQLQHMLRETF